MENHTALTREMIQYEKGGPGRIHHFLKVHSFAKLIAALEGLPDKETYILEAAALVHDIGIQASLDKHGSDAGNLQEQEGPPIAEEMLRRLGYDRDVVDRVCYLVAHHHTYKDIVGMDYQILVEADFLVNIYEGQMPKERAESVQKNIFRTKAGRELMASLYGVSGT